MKSKELKHKIMSMTWEELLYTMNLYRSTVIGKMAHDRWVEILTNKEYIRMRRCKTEEEVEEKRIFVVHDSKQYIPAKKRLSELNESIFKPLIAKCKTLEDYQNLSTKMNSGKVRRQSHILNKKIHRLERIEAAKIANSMSLEDIQNRRSWSSVTSDIFEKRENELYFQELKKMKNDSLENLIRWGASKRLAHKKVKKYFDELCATKFLAHL